MSCTPYNRYRVCRLYVSCNYVILLRLVILSFRCQPPMQGLDLQNLHDQQLKCPETNKYQIKCDEPFLITICLRETLRAYQTWRFYPVDDVVIVSLYLSHI